MLIYLIHIHFVKNVHKTLKLIFLFHIAWKLSNQNPFKVLKFQQDKIQNYSNIPCSKETNLKCYKYCPITTFSPLGGHTCKWLLISAIYNSTS